jgi:hypothetical protein
MTHMIQVCMVNFMEPEYLSTMLVRMRSLDSGPVQFVERMAKPLR